MCGPVHYLDHLLSVQDYKFQSILGLASKTNSLLRPLVVDPKDGLISGTLLFVVLSLVWFYQLCLIVCCILLKDPLVQCPRTQVQIHPSSQRQTMVS